MIKNEDSVVVWLLSVFSGDPLISLGEEAGFHGLHKRTQAGTESIAAQSVAGVGKLFDCWATVKKLLLTYN